MLSPWAGLGFDMFTLFCSCFHQFIMFGRACRAFERRPAPENGGLRSCQAASTKPSPNRCMRRAASRRRSSCLGISLARSEN
jgi:hypothetical protein